MPHALRPDALRKLSEMIVEAADPGGAERRRMLGEVAAALCAMPVVPSFDPRPNAPALHEPKRARPRSAGFSVIGDDVLIGGVRADIRGDEPRRVLLALCRSPGVVIDVRRLVAGDPRFVVKRIRDALRAQGFGRFARRIRCVRACGYRLDWAV